MNVLSSLPTVSRNSNHTHGAQEIHSAATRNAELNLNFSQPGGVPAHARIPEGLAALASARYSNNSIPIPRAPIRITMNILKSVVIGLSLAAVGMGVEIWQQQRQIDSLSRQLAEKSIQLTSSVVQQAQQEVALNKVTTELVEQRTQFAAQVSPTSKKQSPPTLQADQIANANVASSSAGSVSMEIVKNWDKSNGDPDIERMRSEFLRAQVQRKYGALYRQLNLGPEIEDKLTNLLLDKKQATTDVAVASVQQGQDPMDDAAGFSDIVAAERKEVEKQIGSLLGEQGYAAYQAYGRTLVQASTLSQVQQSFAATGTPVSSEQLAQLQQIMINNNAAHLNQKVINQSHAFLSDQQVQAMQALYKDQRAATVVRRSPQNVVPKMAVPVTKTAK